MKSATRFSPQKPIPMVLLLAVLLVSLVMLSPRVLIAGEDVSEPTPELKEAHPLVNGLQSILDLQEARLNALKADLNRSSEPLARLAIQKEIQEAKRETEIALLLMQLDYFEERGEQELAERLRAALSHLQSERVEPPSMEHRGEHASE